MAVQESPAGDWRVTFSTNATQLRGMEALLQEDLDKIYLHITGMTCASCVGSIEKGLMKKKGKEVFFLFLWIGKGLQRLVLCILCSYALKRFFIETHCGLSMCKESHV